MMPDQSQGAVSAFEDAAALGLIFTEDKLKNYVRPGWIEKRMLICESRGRRNYKLQACEHD